jgi:hypothetical protein
MAKRKKDNTMAKRKKTTQWPKEKKTNNDLQNTKQKTTDRITRTPLQAGSELGCSGRVSSSFSTSDTRPVATWNFSVDRKALINLPD